MKIVFATNNKHKLDEIRSILGSRFEILSLNVSKIFLYLARCQP